MSTTDRRRGPIEHTVLSVIDRMPLGRIHVQTPDGRRLVAGGGGPGVDAHIRMSDPRAWRRTALRGANGFADGYLAGEWDTDDLDAVLAWGAQNVAARPNKLPMLGQPVSLLAHWLRDNTPTGSKRNIQAHYDLGNDFYTLWLDETMTYSSALFDAAEPDATPLADAQRRKWDRLLDQLQPGPKDRILEIGCGWGGFAVHAAKEAGCCVTGITLSEEQREWARRRVEHAGLEGKVDIRLQDYRRVPERYDAIASIEMFEAVGERWWPVFFRNLKDRLDGGGRAALQVITIDDDHFAGYRLRPEFAQEHIFPGGMLPSPSAFRQVAGDAGLHVGEPYTFGMSYARTLATWRERFEAVLPQVRALGFDETFIRTWRYYLCYCRAAFEARNIDVMQVTLDAR